MMADSAVEGVTDGDIIVVAGASGRIGRLVTKRYTRVGHYGDSTL